MWANIGAVTAASTIENACIPLVNVAVAVTPCQLCPFRWGHTQNRSDNAKTQTILAKCTPRPALCEIIEGVRSTPENLKGSLKIVILNEVVAPWQNKKL